MRIFPVVGRSTPPSRLSSVVFPQPLGPMIATASPVRTCHELSRSAWTSSAAVQYCLLTPVTVTLTPLFLNTRPSALCPLHRPVCSIAVHPPTEPRRDAHQQNHHEQRHPGHQRLDDEPRREQLDDGANL